MLHVGTNQHPAGLHGTLRQHAVDDKHRDAHAQASTNHMLIDDKPPRTRPPTPPTAPGRLIAIVMTVGNSHGHFLRMMACGFAVNADYPRMCGRPGPLPPCWAFLRGPLKHSCSDLERLAMPVSAIFCRIRSTSRVPLHVVPSCCSFFCCRVGRGSLPPRWALPSGCFRQKPDRPRSPAFLVN